MRRDVQARLGHDRQQADRLERDRLAARVWPGDDQGPELEAEVDVDRATVRGSASGVGGSVRRSFGFQVLPGWPSGVLLLSAEEGFEQGMAGPSEVQLAFEC